MTSKQHHWPRVIVVLLALTVLAACGGGSGDGSSSDEEVLEDALKSALGAGGGGLLIFDGEEIPIESVVCVIRDDMIDVGTISESGHRVLIGTNRAENPISTQILDQETLQWFPQDVTGDEAEHDGNTFTSGPTLYFNNSDSRVVEASFTVECP